MSSTPLFDSIARRAEGTEHSARTPARTAAVLARCTDRPAPTSPVSATECPAQDVHVPAALVAAIDEIPARVTRAMQTELVVSPSQLVLVEAVADAITRAVVDAVATELEHIARDGVVRA